MTRMLLVQDDPLVCKPISKCLKSRGADELKWARTGRLAVRMITRAWCDVAIISATMPDMSGIDLAKLAQNENIAVLMLSPNPGLSEELKRLDYRYLQKPFTFHALLSEAKRAARETKASTSSATQSVTIAEANLEVLKAEMAESHRRFDAIVARLGYWKR